MNKCQLFLCVKCRVANCQNYGQYWLRVLKYGFRKKFSTDQRFIRKEVTSYKIHILHISKSETFRYIVFEVKADSEIEIKPIDLSVTLIR